MGDFSGNPNLLVSTGAPLNSAHDVGAREMQWRVQFSATPNTNAAYVRDGGDRPDLKESIAQISLLQRPGYMGPAPPGFVDEIRPQFQTWSSGAVIETTLRLRVLHSDFSTLSPAQEIFMVRFISHQKLDTTADSLHWQWIVCGRTANATSKIGYALCQDGPD